MITNYSMALAFKVFAGVSAGYGVLGAIILSHDQKENVGMHALSGAMIGLCTPFVSISSAVVVPMVLMATPVFDVAVICIEELNKPMCDEPMRWSNDI